MFMTGVKHTMIEIAQAGQAGKTGLLFDMHRLRARVFKDTLKWDVEVDHDGLETDRFDIPEAVYLLALNKQMRVIGGWRLLSTTGPTMIRDIWPQYMDSLPMPVDKNIFEVSRFAVHSPEADPQEAARQTQQAVGEMFCAMTELCLMTGIKEIFTLYDERIAKVISRIDCHPYKTSVQIPINGMNCQTGVFKMDQDMLKRLRAATGVAQNLITNIDLPPAVVRRLSQKQAGGAL